jgi:predicted phosphodiesterase
MPIAALYDIHGNLPALDAVLADLEHEEVDAIVVGGDVVPGPMPVETLERLLGLDLPVRFLHGNGESAVLAEAAGEDPGVPEAVREVIRWTAEALGPALLEEIRGWPGTVRLESEGFGDALFCHATPRSDTEIFTGQTTEGVLLPIFEPLGVDLVVCGHTHMQFDRNIGATRVVNAGSVGMPFGETGAHWLLLGDPAGEIELWRTPYDLDAAADVIRRSGYPRAEHFAENHVRTCPSKEEMLAAFARAELG